MQTTVVAQCIKDRVDGPGVVHSVEVHLKMNRKWNTLKRNVANLRLAIQLKVLELTASDAADGHYSVIVRLHGALLHLIPDLLRRWYEGVEIERCVIHDRCIRFHIFTIILLGVLHGYELIAVYFAIKLIPLHLIFKTIACFRVYCVLCSAPATKIYFQTPSIVRLSVPLQIEIIA